MLPTQAQDATETSQNIEIDLRKKLFIFERALARREPKTAKPLRDLVLNRYGEVKLPDRIDPTSGDDSSKSALPSASGAGGEEKKEPANVTVSLGGGSLTGYSLSAPGLDLSGDSCAADKTTKTTPESKASADVPSEEESAPGEECKAILATTSE